MMAPNSFMGWKPLFGRMVVSEDSIAEIHQLWWCNLFIYDSIDRNSCTNFNHVILKLFGRK